MEEYNYEVQRILKNAEQEMLNLNHPYVGSEHLLLSLLKCERVKKICDECNLSYDSFKKELIDVVGKSNIKSRVILYTPLLRLILDNALVIAKKKDEQLDELILLSSILTTDDGIAIRIMEYMDIDIDKLYSKLSSNNASILKELGNNLNNKVDEILIGRDKEIDNVIKILLRKKKNNPILIGKAGVGKSAIVYELARRIKNNEVLKELRNSKIISVDMATLLSNTKYRGEFESRLNSIIEELKNNKDIILFIDEIHTIVKSGSDNSIDAANILKPYLASDDIKVIGATTINEYERYIANDKALARRFEKVFVDEPDDERVIEILKGVREEYEDYHKVRVSDKNICDIVKLANKYIYFNSNPDKSLDVLDYVCSKVKLESYNRDIDLKCNEFLRDKNYDKALNYRIKKKKNVITYEDIVEVVQDISNIRLLKHEDYKQLIDTLDNKVYGQDLTELKRILKKRFIIDKVLGLLIRGASGVGKRYTAEIIGEVLKYNMIELDMNDYSSSTSLSKILGVDPGYVGYKDRCLLDEIKYHPYSLILLKNIDNASYNVISFFKTILKDGYVMDKNGDKVNFNNCLIIMTSNNIKNRVGYNKMNNEDFIVDNVVDYELISKEELRRFVSEHNIDEKVMDKFKDYNSFNDINIIIEDFLYINSNSMI